MFRSWVFINLLNIKIRIRIVEVPIKTLEINVSPKLFPTPTPYFILHILGIYLST